MVLSKKLRKASKKAINETNPFDPQTKVTFSALDMVR